MRVTNSKSMKFIYTFHEMIIHYTNTFFVYLCQPLWSAMVYYMKWERNLEHFLNFALFYRFVCSFPKRRIVWLCSETDVTSSFTSHSQVFFEYVTLNFTTFVRFNLIFRILTYLKMNLIFEVELVVTSDYEHSHTISLFDLGCMITQIYDIG